MILEWLPTFHRYKLHKDVSYIALDGAVRMKRTSVAFSLGPLDGGGSWFRDIQVLIQLQII